MHGRIFTLVSKVNAGPETGTPANSWDPMLVANTAQSLESVSRVAGGCRGNRPHRPWTEALHNSNPEVDRKQNHEADGAAKLPHPQMAGILGFLAGCLVEAGAEPAR